MDNKYLYLKSTTNPLTNVLQKIAFNELNETEIKRVEYLVILRKWLKTISILQSITFINDNFLLTFLRGSKFDLKSAQNKILNYFLLQNTLPEIFNSQRDCNNSQLIEIVKAG